MSRLVSFSRAHFHLGSLLLRDRAPPVAPRSIPTYFFKATTRRWEVIVSGICFDLFRVSTFLRNRHGFSSRRMELFGREDWVVLKWRSVSYPSPLFLFFYIFFSSVSRGTNFGKRNFQSRDRISFFFSSFFFFFSSTSVFVKRNEFWKRNWFSKNIVKIVSIMFLSYFSLLTYYE